MIEKSEGDMLRLESPPNKAIKVSLSASGRTELDTTGTERPFADVWHLMSFQLVDLRILD